MDYLPFDVEKQVLMLKTGINEEQAEIILKIIHKLRSDHSVPIAVSTRHSLMIADLVAMGATIREAVMYSLQISKDILESLLLSIHVETKDMQILENKYLIFKPNSRSR
jgi:nitric oxide reductase NorQ protein